MKTPVPKDSGSGQSLVGFAIQACLHIKPARGWAFNVHCFERFTSQPFMMVPVLERLRAAYSIYFVISLLLSEALTYVVNDTDSIWASICKELLLLKDSGFWVVEE